MLKFSKYHGLGNDFIIFSESDIIKYQEESNREIEYSTLALEVCNRNLGIGADGMMVLAKSDIADYKMLFFNSDGSVAPMCGNGIRCFSNYIFDNNLLEGNRYRVETLAGVMVIDISQGSLGEFLAKVDMGVPDFNLDSIPMNREVVNREGELNEYIDISHTIRGAEYRLSSLFMGTTHTVIFVDNIDTINKEEIGKIIENNRELYPVKTNVNFAQIVDRDNIKMKTWERGVGMTLACGTGACATVVVGSEKLRKLNKKVDVHLEVGILTIELGERVYMRGPSKRVAQGIYFI